MIWRVLGPEGCDAVLEEDNIYILLRNALHHQQGILTDNELLPSKKTLSPFGPTSFDIPHDLLTYAQELLWHDQSPDPTGLIWMGARYYDPKTGRFLSPDPIGLPLVQDLYVYANGDPINLHDPDGRFASHIYKNSSPFCPTIFLPFLANKHMDTWMQERGLFASRIETIAGPSLRHGRIGLVNGIGTSFDELREMGSKVHGYAQNKEEDLIHNASHYGDIDALECGINLFGIHTPVTKLLIRQFERFGEDFKNDPKAKYLMICHSGGAGHTYNALKAVTPELRSKIVVLAIAPSRVIPQKLCYKSSNYISGGHDFVPYLGITSWFYLNELIHLKKHEDAPWFDHSFLSPTFDQELKDGIHEFINEHGGNK